MKCRPSAVAVSARAMLPNGTETMKVVTPLLLLLFRQGERVEHGDRTDRHHAER